MDAATDVSSGSASNDPAWVSDPAWSNIEPWHTVLPASQPLVTLANWQVDPYLAWSFQHMREVMPSQVIAASTDSRSFVASHASIDDIPVEGVAWARTVGEVLSGTHTDGFAVLRDGALVSERYLGTMNPRRKHLVMSVTKSVVSCVVARLVTDGLIDLNAAIETYVPELADCGYVGASVRTILDMRSGIAFHETYLDPDSEVRTMERSMGWAPRTDGDPLGMYPYILTIRPEGEHGGVFTYRSIDTDVLGWMCERVTGRRMADLISDVIWMPIGARFDAEITCDPLGSAIHDGGLSGTLLDLARFGQMLADDGRVGDVQVVDSDWIADCHSPPEGVREAFAASENEPYLPGGWYRSQFWMLPGTSGRLMLALGIHGQMVFVDRSTRTVCVKMSSWPQPQNADYLAATISACRALSAAAL